MSSTEISQSRTLRRANDAFAAGVKPPRPLFGEFWREGELALLFGAAGTGKSLLAVQLAESLSRGRRIEGLDGPAKPLSVLYVDLVLSDAQFVMRYSRETRGGTRRGYRFSARFFRDRPADDEPLAVWLRRCIIEQKINAVVIDDLSVVTRSDDGTRETYELVRELRNMTRELGVSILVLADSLAPVFVRDITERDLRRTRVLCGYSDSVFAIEAAVETGRRNLVQTRSQAGKLVWTHRRPAQFTIEQRDDGLIELELYRPELTPEECETIIRIKAMRESGKPFRSIANELKIPKSTVARLHSRWRLSDPPVSAGGQFAATVDDPSTFDPTQHEDYFPGCEEYDEASEDPKFDMEFMDEDEEGYDPHEQDLLRREGYLIELARAEAHEAYRSTGVAPRLADNPKYKEFVESIVSEPPASAGGQIDDVDAPGEPPHSPAAGPPANAGGSDLEPALDAYGREILIESREKHSGRPLVWYQTDKKGTTRRFRRDIFGINIERVDKMTARAPP